MNPPVGLASVVLVIVLVLECLLAALQVLQGQFEWAAFLVPVTAAVLGVLRVRQIPRKDG